MSTSNREDVLSDLKVLEVIHALITVKPTWIPISAVQGIIEKLDVSTFKESLDKVTSIAIV